jgi:hypothetical protein
VESVDLQIEVRRVEEGKKRRKSEKEAKRCQPTNLGELGDLLVAETATGW